MKSVSFDWAERSHVHVDLSSLPLWRLSFKQIRLLGVPSSFREQHVTHHTCSTAVKLGFERVFWLSILALQNTVPRWLARALGERTHILRERERRQHISIYREDEETVFTSAPVGISW